MSNTRLNFSICSSLFFKLKNKLKEANEFTDSVNTQLEGTLYGISYPPSEATMIQENENWIALEKQKQELIDCLSSIKIQR